VCHGNLHQTYFNIYPTRRNITQFSWFQTFAVFCVLYVFLWVIPLRLNFIRRRFGTLCLFHLHIYLLVYEDGTECSETLTYKIQTPGNYPQENIQHYTVYFIWKLLYMFRVAPSPIIRSANNCIYSIWYLSHRYCYLPLSWKSWNWFECAVGGVRHPQHIQTSGR